MKFKNIIYICLLLPLISSCSDYLDQVPNDRQTMDEVFQKKGPTEQYLANVYSFVPDESNVWEGCPWVGNTDELEVAWAKYPIYRINVGNWNAADAPFSNWNNYYTAIRSASYFMKNIDGNAEILKLDGQDLIDQYKAEARFLRAYYYFLLMRQYGPVVIIGENVIPVDASVDDVQLQRTPFDSCVSYVVNELDKSILDLPLTQSQEKEYGRVTKGVAMAVKSRLLLYAASPEYNGNTAFADFKNLDGTPLISQTYNKEKWKKAADAAKAVIDLNLYDLYKDPSGDPVKSYRGIHLVAWNNEGIFVRKNNGLSGYDVHCSLRSAGGWNGLAPLQEMVDAYFMKDGKSISESPLYSETGSTAGIFNMYLNREPRFYASILYNGRKYKGGAITKDSIVTQMNYTGKDGKKSGGEDYSHTGYLVYKNVSPETNRLTNKNNSRPFILYRLGEIYLNYAEALAEYGGADDEALIYLNLIRERAGVPEYGSDELPAVTGAALIEKIRAERRVELAFEGHRWFDVRRWKIAESMMGDMHGMDVNSDGDKFYKRVVVATHSWKESYYWWPIAQYEMDRAFKVVQNPGW